MDINLRMGREREFFRIYDCIENEDGVDSRARPEKEGKSQSTINKDFWHPAGRVGGSPICVKNAARSPPFPTKIRKMRPVSTAL